jgi:hypothetical protein
LLASNGALRNITFFTWQRDGESRSARKVKPSAKGFPSINMVILTREKRKEFFLKVKKCKVIYILKNEKKWQTSRYTAAQC